MRDRMGLCTLQKGAQQVADAHRRYEEGRMREHLNSTGSNRTHVDKMRVQ